MKKSILLIVSILLGSLAMADEGILLQRIIALEKRVAELETKLAPVLEEERVKGIIKEQQQLAFDRMMLDAEQFSRTDLRIIEKMYKTISEDWKSDEAKKGFELLKQKYPTSNRTGCSILYLGQMTSGSEQLDHLKLAIEKYSGCYYETGVNIGAYARLYLGMRYKNEGKEKEAEALFEELKSLYPDAIDHKGKLLSTHLDELD